MASKLPVLYAAFTSAYVKKEDMVWREFGFRGVSTDHHVADRWVAMDRLCGFKSELVEYHPARYCSTCLHFEPGIAAWCGNLGRNVPQDGKWSCGDHKEKSCDS